MYKKIILFLAIIIFAISAYSQEVENATTIDKDTYILWLAKDWDRLITIGKTAIKNGVDFYYLRVRMGIAYFEKKNYHKAIYHFEKAYKFNPNEYFLKEYLYFAYLYAGRQTEAGIFASSFTQSQKEKLKIDDGKFIDELKFTYNTSFNDDQSTTENYSISVAENKDGFQQISKKLDYFNISLKHQISPKFSIFHGYSNINKTSFLYTQYDSVTEENSNNKSTLHQYYFSMNARVAKNFNMQTGFHYLSIQYTAEDSTFRQGQVYNTITDNDFLGFLSMYKDINYFTLGGTIYYAGLNDAKQLQSDVLFFFYPFGNVNLYFVSTLSLQWEKYSTNQPTKQFVFDQQIGIKLIKNIWIEGHATFGDLHNFIKNDGFVVYNGLDVIKQMYGGRLIIPLKSAFQFRVDYSFITNESSFFPTIPENNTYNTIQYNSHSITGRITWNL